MAYTCNMIHVFYKNTKESEIKEVKFNNCSGHVHMHL